MQRVHVGSGTTDCWHGDINIDCSFHNCSQTILKWGCLVWECFVCSIFSYSKCSKEHARTSVFQGIFVFYSFTSLNALLGRFVRVLWATNYWSLFDVLQRGGGFICLCRVRISQANKGRLSVGLFALCSNLLRGGHLYIVLGSQMDRWVLGSQHQLKMGIGKCFEK